MDIKHLFIKEDPEENNNGKNAEAILAKLKAESQENIEPASSLANDVQPITNEDLTTVIDDIYKSLQLPVEKSIYSVIPFLNGLPQSLNHTETKTTLVAMLKAAGFDINNLITDSEQRIASLGSYNEKIVSDTEKIIGAKNNEINEKLKEIDILKDDITKAQTNSHDHCSVIHKECDKLKKLNDYLQ